MEFSYTALQSKSTSILDGFVDIMLSPRVPNKDMDAAANFIPSKENMLRMGEPVLQNNDSDPTPFLGMSKAGAIEEEMLSYSQIEQDDNQLSGNSRALIREIMQLKRQIWRQTMTSAMKKSIELKKSLDQHKTCYTSLARKNLNMYGTLRSYFNRIPKMVIMMVAMTLIAWPMKSYWICFMYMFAVTHVDT